MSFIYFFLLFSVLTSHCVQTHGAQARSINEPNLCVALQIVCCSIACALLSFPTKQLIVYAGCTPNCHRFELSDDLVDLLLLLLQQHLINSEVEKIQKKTRASAHTRI